MPNAERKSILVVDDEEIIRDFLLDVLGEDYDVTTVDDGDQAIKRLTKARFDLVITDLKMPRVSGEEVVKFARAKHPEAAVIVISGYSSLYAASQSVQSGAGAFLSKPFSIHQLLQTVEQCLGA
jgi:DNA-binding NtrC family response regulator